MTVRFSGPAFLRPLLASIITSSHEKQIGDCFDSASTRFWPSMEAGCRMSVAAEIRSAWASSSSSILAKWRLTSTVVDKHGIGERPQMLRRLQFGRIRRKWTWSAACRLSRLTAHLYTVDDAMSTRESPSSPFCTTAACRDEKPFGALHRTTTDAKSVGPDWNASVSLTSSPR
jgi:hypothetical protein